VMVLKNSRSMRSRSFSRCKRAISAASSTDGSVACVVRRRVAAVGSAGPLAAPPTAAARNRAGQAPSQQIRSRARSTLPDQPLAVIVIRKRPTLTSFHPTPPGSSSLLQVSIKS
jgi:hypothetical protein